MFETGACRGETCPVYLRGGAATQSGGHELNLGGFFGGCSGTDGQWLRHSCVQSSMLGTVGKE